MAIHIVLIDGPGDHAALLGAACEAIESAGYEVGERKLLGVDEDDGKLLATIDIEGEFSSTSWVGHTVTSIALKPENAKSPFLPNDGGHGSEADCDQCSDYERSRRTRETMNTHDGQNGKTNGNRVGKQHYLNAYEADDDEAASPPFSLERPDCLYATCGATTTIRTLVDSWLSDYIQKHGVDPDYFPLEATPQMVRDAILATLSEKDRSNYELQSRSSCDLARRYAATLGIDPDDEPACKRIDESEQEQPVAAIRIRVGVKLSTRAWVVDAIPVPQSETWRNLVLVETPKPEARTRLFKISELTTENAPSTEVAATFLYCGPEAEFQPTTVYGSHLLAHYDTQTTMRGLVDVWLLDYAKQRASRTVLNSLPPGRVREAVLAILTPEGIQEYHSKNPSELAREYASKNGRDPSDLEACKDFDASRWERPIAVVGLKLSSRYITSALPQAEPPRTILSPPLLVSKPITTVTPKRNGRFGPLAAFVGVFAAAYAVYFAINLAFLRQSPSSTPVHQTAPNRLPPPTSRDATTIALLAQLQRDNATLRDELEKIRIAQEQLKTSTDAIATQHHNALVQPTPLPVAPLPENVSAQGQATPQSPMPRPMSEEMTSQPSNQSASYGTSHSPRVADERPWNWPRLQIESREWTGGYVGRVKGFKFQKIVFVLNNSVLYASGPLDINQTWSPEIMRRAGDGHWLAPVGIMSWLRSHSGSAYTQFYAVLCIFTDDGNFVQIPFQKLSSEDEAIANSAMREALIERGY